MLPDMAQVLLGVRHPTHVTIHTELSNAVGVFSRIFLRETPHVVSAAAGAGKGYIDQYQ